MFMLIVHIPIPVLLYQLQPSIHCIYTGRSSGSQVLDHHCKDRRYQPRQENREGPVFNWGRNQSSPGFQEVSASSSSLTQQQLSHLAEWRPFVLPQRVHVVIGICICQEHSHCAQLIKEVQADTRGIPKPHCAILMPEGEDTRTHITQENSTWRVKQRGNTEPKK